MVEFRPFRGVRYNRQLMKDLSKLICSPSDIITPELQRELYRRSEYNFVRLDASLGSVDDTCRTSRWQRARVAMEDWLSKGALQVDELPSIYLHDHHFTYRGREYMRRGIIARVRLEEWERMIIRPHERILPELAKSRFSQIKHMKANTSPLMALYRDSEGQVSSLLSVEKLDTPIIELHSNEEGTHYIWAITEPKLIEQICNTMAEKPLYLADGHHRYASALAFKAENYASNPAASRDAPFNFVMMTLTSASDPGLVIRPFHRLIRGVPGPILNELLTGLGTFFEVEEWSLNMPDIWQKADDLLTKTDSDKPGGIVMLLYGLSKDRLYILRVGDFDIIEREMPASHSEAYKRLDVSIADHIIIEKLLRIDSHNREKSLGFSNERAGAVRRVSEGEYQLALLLRAISAKQIIEIADAGETMPEKATRFYPKVSTGFVFYRLM